MTSEAKRVAIAKINEKLGPGGWYSEDFKAGFDFGWDAALDTEWDGVTVRGISPRSISCPAGCAEHLHAGDGTPVGFKREHNPDCRCDKCLSDEASPGLRGSDE